MTENAARPNEAEWRELLEHSPLMYFVVDVSGKVVSVNESGAAELGYHVDELVGQSVFEVFPDSDRERVRRNVDLCLERPGQLNAWEARKPQGRHDAVGGRKPRLSSGRRATWSSS